jgi:(1->4)-alpha-D-glucan 1-alpha-D-glucosylmutase
MRSAIPSATYRLQLHKGFGFADAAVRVPYFVALGISHLYLSPILAARAGSRHGYDVIDHRRINPELGGEEGFRTLAGACHGQGLGLIVDIVPNHMAVGGADNRYWLDVLENGSGSRYAPMFDIDFDRPGLEDKVLVPVLGEPYGDALAEGKLSLVWDEPLEKLAIAYGPHRLPIRPSDYVVVGDWRDLSRWRDPAALHALLECQHFRLAWWRTAGDRINWRRFFDVNELAGLRVEDEAVFEQVHAVTFRHYAEGLIDGVRIDHIDGLADPSAYLQRLKARLTALNDARPLPAPKDGPYIVVEKILGTDEALPRDWDVQGTTGYDFMNDVSALLHDAGGEDALNRLWEELSGRPAAFVVEERADRVEILQSAFAAQLAACAQAFAAVADRQRRDLGDEGFRRAIVAFIRHLHVYRGYATGRPHPIEPALRQAMEAASAASPADRPSLDFIARVLPGGIAEAGEAIRRLNQLTAPVAAKAVEDTAFYRYSRLLSRNDVGFDAGRFALSAESFLGAGRIRAATLPYAMLATATHDHKRGEDVRARLAILTEVPEKWRAVVTEWLGLACHDRIARDDAYTLFQTLVGAWPPALSIDDADGLKAFGDRVARWREKSLREAKLRSSWAAPDADYEAANQAWLRQLLDPRQSRPFLESLGRFVAWIAPAGAVNGLVQTALRCTWPGVPDLYQGAEFWDFSLVDPDNRRPVDYDLRARVLADPDQGWRSDAVKQALIARILRLRRHDPALFTIGALDALPVHGTRRNHVLAFARRLENRQVIVAVMLRTAAAMTEQGALPDAAWWSDTEVVIGDDRRTATTLFQAGPVFLEASGLPI